MRNVVITREMVKMANDAALDASVRADTDPSNPALQHLAISYSAIADTFAWIVGDGAPYGVLSEFDED